MIKLPLNGKWTQPNDSSKLGSIYYSKNINLDESGFLKLSPRAVNIFDDTETLSNAGSTNFDLPVALGRYGNGLFRMVTKDEPFNISISDTGKSISEDVTSSNPNLNSTSHGCWWQNRYHESTDTAVSYNTSGTWTANAITGLTSGVRHTLCVFKNRNQLCVADGSTVKQYDTSYASTTNLVLSSDFEVLGMAYNNYNMGIITRLGSDSAGQNSDSYFFVWDGSSTSADTGVSIGAYTAVCVFPYKSSFVVINSLGQLLYWNGGGFDELAHFPFYVSEHRWGQLTEVLSYGDNIVVDGDTILINLGFVLNSSGRYEENYDVRTPSGVWCYDPDVGLYHKSSPSASRAYAYTVASASINTTTNIITIGSTYTIPETGNPIILVNGTVGGLTQGKVYFLIKLSSSTISIAETKELAQAGVAIDITSVDTLQYFWVFNLIDYSITSTDRAGAIGLLDVNDQLLQGYLTGVEIPNTSLVDFYSLCIQVSLLENRGYIVTPKFYLDSKTEQVNKCVIKHAPLDVNDSIIVKYKLRERIRIPTITPVISVDTDFVTWTSPYECYTTFDLSEAKTAFDSGEEMEFEIIAGCGAGTMVKISNLTYTSGTYNLTLSENVIGVTIGGKSNFIIDNWIISAVVNYDKQDSSGIYDFLIGDNSKAYQFKIELRGYNTKIEDVFFTNLTYKPIQ